MEAYESEFIEFLFDKGVIKTDGPYKLKSGRISPYFLDFGELMGNTETLSKLSDFCVSAIERKIGCGNFDLIVGPPEKGKLLSLAIGSRIFERYGKPKNITYLRKLPKGHGESKGESWFYGAEPQPTDRVLVVDDVYTEGTSVKECKKRLEDFGRELEVGPLEYVATFVLVDRQESEDTVYSIVTVSDIFLHPAARRSLGEGLDRCVRYLQENGNSAARSRSNTLEL